MTENIYDIVELTENEWLHHSLYVLKERAIPSMIDGMKPSQRFYTYASLKMTKDDFDKIDAVAGSLAKYGYAHGSVNGAGAAQLMAADWYTSVPIIKGRGSFGSRLIQSPGAPRYVYTKIHENFYKYFKDLDLSPAHEDPEILIPKYYIPVIPYVLLNCVSGLATGFATNIIARNVDDVIFACKEYIKTGNITKKLRYTFPNFKGKTEFVDGKVVQYGIFERNGKNSIIITEVPYMNSKNRYDRESYVEHLDTLEDNGQISSYVDRCSGSGFKFEIKFKRGSEELTDDEIYDLFKLKSVVTENLTVISPSGSPKTYGDAHDLIKEFCDYRKPYLKKRIDTNIEKLEEENRWKRVKMYFILAVLENRIIFKDKKKSDIIKQIEVEVNGVVSEDIERLLKINFTALTQEGVSELAQEILDNKKELKYWKSTTVDEQFLKDLESL